MHLIDTHSHLYLTEFDHDIEQVVQRALDSGIRKIILPNIDSSTVQDLLKLTKKYPDLFIPLIGLHPTHVKGQVENELQTVNQYFTTGYFKGIGEIGIDLYWDKTFIREQIYAFEWQLQFAFQHNLPVVIHTRESFAEIFESVSKPEFIGVRGIFHAFTGNVDQARFVINLGYLIGIGGILTYKNSVLVDVVKNIDLQHIVLETDSPFLPPVPYRGKRNESSYLVKITEKIAEIKSVTIDTVAEITTANAEKLFGI